MRAMLLVSLTGLALGAAAFVGACSSASNEDAAGPASPEAAPAPSAAAPAAEPGVPPGSGKVLETMNSGGYTYVRVDLAGAETWAAGPQVAVKVGDTVTLPVGMAMRDYHSSTLNRTFPLVWFVPTIGTGGAAAPADPAAAMAEAHKAARAAGPAPAGAPVERLEGGQTVEEVVSKAAEFAGKDVALRARVVKANFGIMGANWLHVQDGTGGPGTNDLTVTTDAKVAVGDVVVVRGKVVTDRDFGSGYKYAVILEKAAVEKQ